MRLLNKLWLLALVFNLGALMDFLLNRNVPTLSTFITWAVMIGIVAILTLCTMQMRMMEPPKKKRLPVRRASRLKVVSR